MFTPTPNALIDGRYELIREIGSGAMGSVWAASDTQLDAPCALKFIAERFASEQHLRARFMREARVASNIRSPHAITIFGVGEWQGSLYIAMELLEGETLGDRLDSKGVLPFAAVLKLTQQVAEVLDRAHALGVVHRDLKPDNLWLCSGKDLFVKVLDFGVARQLDSMGTVQTATGMVIGTPQYMSPEQASGSKEVDHRSDLWSLAVIVAECLTGKVVFDASGIGELFVKILTAPIPPLCSLGPHLPQSMEAWWSRAMARDPRSRFGSASELAVALRVCGSAFQSGPTVDARAPGVAPGVGPTAPMPVPPRDFASGDEVNRGGPSSNASGAPTLPGTEVSEAPFTPGAPLDTAAARPSSSGTAPMEAFAPAAQRPSTVEPVSSQPRARSGGSAAVALRSFGVVLGAIGVLAALAVGGLRLIGDEQGPDAALSSETLPSAWASTETPSEAFQPEASQPEVPARVSADERPDEAPSVHVTPPPSQSAPAGAPQRQVPPSPVEPAASAPQPRTAPSPRVNRSPQTPAAARPPPETRARPATTRQSLERQLGF